MVRSMAQRAGIAENQYRELTGMDLGDVR